MRCGDDLLEASELYRVYVRDLILVARCGDARARQRFLEQYAGQLRGLEARVGELPAWEQEYVFSDAVRALETGGETAHSLMGFRLAIPTWFRGRVVTGSQVRRSTAETYRPDRLEVDPVCGMLVDPEEAPFRLLAGDEELFFCCLGCLHAYRMAREDRPVEV